MGQTTEEKFNFVFVLSLFDTTFPHPVIDYTNGTNVLVQVEANFSFLD